MIKEKNFLELGSLCTKIGSGITPKGGESVYVDKGTSLIRSQNVYNSFFTDNGLAYITDEIAENMASVTVFEGDVLLNITGDSVARCCLAPKPFLPARVNQHVMILRPKRDILDSAFLSYYLTSPRMQSILLSLAGSGGTRKALTKAMLERLLIPSLPLVEQRKIASMLSTCDELIENNRRRIQLLEQAIRLIYEEWFIRFRFPGHEKVRIVDGLSEGWRFIEIREITSFISRGITPTYRADAEYVVLNQKCIRNKKIDFSLSQKQSKRVSSEKLIRFGDVLINSTGTGTLGRVAQLWINVENTTVDSHISIVRPQSFINHYWFGMTLLYKEPIFETLGEGSTNQTELKREKIGAQQVLLPPENIQKKFEDICQPIISQISTLQKQIENLKIARDLLLPKLMNGEIQV